MKIFFRILVGLLFVALVATFTAKSISANDGKLVFENFSRPIVYRQPGVPSPYKWWVIDDEANTQHYGQPCDPRNISCLTRMKISEDGYFARLQINPDSVTLPDKLSYNNTEFSEMQTGYSYGLHAPWCPSVGHPVSVTQTVRLGTGYNQDGSGAAIGTAGAGLWNSYPVALPGGGFQLNPPTAFWWSWTTPGTFGGALQGLTFDVFQNENPVILQPVTVPINMQSWMTWFIVWSRLSDGNDKITAALQQGSHLYPVISSEIPALGCLSWTAWNDNQLTTLDQNFNLVTYYQNPSQPDYWDLKNILIAQP